MLKTVQRKKKKQKLLPKIVQAKKRRIMSRLTIRVRQPQRTYGSLNQEKTHTEAKEYKSQENSTRSKT